MEVGSVQITIATGGPFEIRVLTHTVAVGGLFERRVLNYDLLRGILYEGIIVFSLKMRKTYARNSSRGCP